MNPGEVPAMLLLKLAHCGLCGVPFAVPAALFDSVVAHQGVLCCPNGHSSELAREPKVEQHIRRLEEGAAALGHQVVDQKLEIERLRATVAAHMLGVATAPEDGIR